MKTEKAVLVGLVHQEQTKEKLIEYLDELKFLSETAGATVIETFIQKLDRPNKKTFVGKGKIAEIGEFIVNNQVDLVIFDDDLSPSQQFSIEKELKVKIIDRSFLILDIFAKRAQTAQARAQVELAQMQYLLPRLRGMWTHLERQQGGIGTRGPGEKEIETDRRIVNKNIANLKNKLELIAKQDLTRRKNRGQLIRVALVGYTNVGKSTLMNVLSKSEVFAENKLFATLDTTVRKVVLDRTPFLLSDTVGFIRKLPHTLIESFKSTLDEVRESDLLIHVVDLAHPQYEDHINVVNKTLMEIGVEDKATILVFNKLDLFEKEHFDEFLKEEEKKIIMGEILEKITLTHPIPVLFISALEKQNIDVFRSTILEKVRAIFTERYPYQTQSY